MKDGDATVGTAVIKGDGSVIISLSEEYLKQHDYTIKGGSFTFSGSFSNEWGGAPNSVIKFGNATVQLPANWIWSDIKTDVKIEKTVQKYPSEEKWDGKTWIYTVTVTAHEDNDQAVDDIIVRDVFTKGGNWVKYADGTFSQGYAEGTDGSSRAPANAVWNVGTLAPGEKATLTYWAQMRDGYTTGFLTEGLVNKAEVYVGNKMMGDASVSQTFDGTLDIDKSSEGKIDDDGTPRITYTVTVTAPDSNTIDIQNVCVKDLFSDGKDNIEAYENITDTKIDKNDQKSQINKSVTDPSNGELSWNIDTVAPGEKRVLTYTVRMKKDFLAAPGAGTAETSEAYFYNCATLLVDNKEWGRSSADTYVEKHWVYKNGFLQQEDGHEGEILFTVDINDSIPNSGKIGIIKDELSGDYVYTGDLVIRVYKINEDGSHTYEKKFKEEIDGKTSWKYKLEEPYDNGKYYIYLEYYAKPTEENEGYPLVNEVEVGIGVGGITYDHKATWSGTSERKSSVEKVYTGGAESGIATWTSTIPCAVKKDSFYYDYVKDPKTQWFTDEQIKAIEVTGVSEEDYRITTNAPDGSGSSKISEGKYKGFWVVFEKAITGITTENPITITYSTTLKTDDLRNNYTQTYQNRAELHIGADVVSSKADCSYTQKTTIEKTAGFYDPTTKELTWYIDVNHKEGSNMVGDATIVDSLPVPMEYVSAKILTESSESSKSAFIKSIETTEDKREITIQVSGLERGSGTRIELVTKLNDPVLDDMDFKKSYQNTAVLKYQGEEIRAQAEKTIVKKKLTKEALYDYTTWPYIEYTVVTNPNGEDLLPGEKTVTVVDQMSEQMELVVDSLTVAYDGQTTSNYVLRNDPAGHKFELVVPDDVAVTIKYRVAFNVPAGERVQATNTVNYQGEVANPGTDDRIILVHDAAATVGVNGNFKLKKTDSETGAVLAGAEFVIKEVTGFGTDGTPVLAEPGQEQTTDRTGMLIFTDLDKNKLYCYYEIAAPEGYETDNTKYYVAFKNVTIPETSSIIVSVIQSGHELSVVNEPVKTGNIKVTKHVTGAAPSEDTFYVALFSDAEGTKRVENQEVRSIKKDESVTFENLVLGTYYVFETDSDGNKLTGYSNGYKLPKNGSKATLTSGSLEENVTIENEYECVSYELPVQKLVNGVSNSSRSFAFELTGEGGYKDSACTEKLSSGDTLRLTDVAVGETKKFAPIYYNKAGTYTYTLKESEAQKYPGYTNDTNEYKITVEVVLENGKLQINSVKKKLTNAAEGTVNELTDVGNAVTFTNRYFAETTVDVNGKKTVEGGKLKAGFQFTIYKEDGTTPATNVVNAAGESVSAAAENTLEGNFGFKLKYTTEDLKKGNSYENRTDFTYIIKETSTDADGYTKRGEEYKVIVTVTNNEANGQLTASVSGVYLKKGNSWDTKSQSLSFVNDYHATGSVKLAGTKQLTGGRKNALADDEFTFTVTENGKSVAEGKSKADGSIEFTEIEYTEANVGLHTYTVSEAKGTDENIEYSGQTQTVTVKVTDLGQGVLGTEVTYPEGQNGVTFTNQYRASGEIVLEVGKQLVGRTSAGLQANEFIFGIYEVEEDAEGYRTETLVEENGSPLYAFNDAEGRVTFPALHYTQEDIGTHKYKIVEFNGRDESITYSTQAFEVTVTVADAGDGGTGKLEVQQTGLTEEAVFENQYHATGSVKLTGQKKLLGNRAQAVQEGEFTFSVKDAEGTEVATGKTLENGIIDFTEISYKQDQVGEHKYTITENTGSDTSVEYSTASVEVTVTVTDIGDGNLEAVASYPEGGVVFENQYHASGSVILEGTKRLIGGRKTPLADDEFTFQVTENGEEVAVGTSRADGSIEFTEISYTEKEIGTHVYEIREMKGSDANITYSTAVVNVTVEVADAGNGVLDVKAAYPAGGVVFENTYTRTHTASIEVTKQLVYNGAAIGAVDQIFYVALYSDEACTNLASEVQPLIFQNASSATVEFSDLEPGRMYYVGESDASGNVISTGTVASGGIFKANFAEGKQSVMTETDGKVTFTFENEFFTIPDGFYKVGELTITKKLLGADGNTAESDDIFYAGIFADEAHTTLSDRVSANMVVLNLNGGASVSETVQVALENGASVTLYVTEVDENGTPVDESPDFAYEVSVDQTSVSLDEEHTLASVVITNKEREEETETETEIETETETESETETETETEIETETETATETETESETEAESEKKPEKKGAVKTGDDTPIALWTTVCLLSLGGIILLLSLRRRKEKNNK